VVVLVREIYVFDTKCVFSLPDYPEDMEICQCCRGQNCSPRSMTILLPYFFVLLNVISDMYSVYKLHPVVCFLLGNSPVSEFYMSTFRNTLSVLSS